MALNTGINSLDAGAPQLRLEGEQQAGGIYNQGSDVKNALAAWANMGPEDRAGFEGFLDFFRTGAWRDQIQGMRQMERDRRTASAPDPQDEMNSFSMEIFGKPLHQLAPEELQELQDLAREQAAGGGRIGLKRGRVVEPGGYQGDRPPSVRGREAEEERIQEDRGPGWQTYAIPEKKITPTTDVNDRWIKKDVWNVGHPSARYDPNLNTWNSYKANLDRIKLRQRIEDEADQKQLIEGVTVPTIEEIIKDLDFGDFETRNYDFGGINGYTATGPDPYLPGLDPASTINNPTWNSVTQEFEYNMRDTSRVDDDISNLLAEEQPALPPWGLFDKPGLPSGYPGTPGSLNKRYIGAKGGRAGFADGLGAGETGIRGLALSDLYKDLIMGDENDDDYTKFSYKDIMKPGFFKQFAADGGRIGRQEGGISQLVTPSSSGERPGYFGHKSILETLTGAPKKVLKKFKKLAKSKLGRLALMYMAGTYAGGTPWATGRAGKWWTSPKFLENLRGGKGITQLGSKLASYIPGTTTVDPVESKKLMAKIIEETGPLTQREKFITGATKALTPDKGDMMKTAMKWGIPIAAAGAGAYTAEVPGETLDEYMAKSGFAGRGKPLIESTQIRSDIDKYLAGELSEEEMEELGYTESYLPQRAASGGRIKAQEGGLMDLGGMEKDYREDGGFVPIGGEEKADDVPARLSKNEFVFTADAVRAAGGGDIDAGAEVMENVMDNLEAGGEISEESQGLEGARDMFANAQQLEKRII